jgi:hypothetical protein
VFKCKNENCADKLYCPTYVHNVLWINARGSTRRRLVQILYCKTAWVRNLSRVATRNLRARKYLLSNILPPLSKSMDGMSWSVLQGILLSSYLVVSLFDIENFVWNRLDLHWSSFYKEKSTRIITWTRQQLHLHGRVKWFSKTWVIARMKSYEFQWPSVGHSIVSMSTA